MCERALNGDALKISHKIKREGRKDDDKVVMQLFMSNLSVACKEITHSLSNAVS